MPRAATAGRPAISTWSGAAPTRSSAARGDDLTVTVPVTFPEAALGADVKVPTLDGDTVTVRIPAGTRSGHTFRVKGRGVARRRTQRRPGDLLVTVEVAVPIAAHRRRAGGGRGAGGRATRRQRTVGV